MPIYIPAGTSDIPDDVARLAHEQHLGSPQAGLPITLLKRGWKLANILMHAAIAGLLIFLGVLFYFLYDLNKMMPLFPVIPGIIAPYLVMIVSMISQKTTTTAGLFYACEEGFILKLSPFRFRVVYWGEVETIQQTTTFLLFRRSSLYAFHCHDDSVFTFSTAMRRQVPGTQVSKNMDEIIEQQFIRRRLPFHFADYQTGQTLNFGPLSVNRDGIYLQDRQLVWEQVADISLVNRGRLLVISQAGTASTTWASLPAWSVSNSGLLLALFKRLRGGESQHAQETVQYGTAPVVVSANQKIDPLPDKLASLAEEHHLGERRVDQALGRKRSILWPWLLVIQAIAIGIGVVIWGGLLYSQFINPLEEDWLRILVFLCYAITLALIGLVPFTTLVKGLQQLPRATYIFEHGLIMQYGQQSPVVYRWDEIVRVEHRFSLLTQLTSNQNSVPAGYWLQRRDGATLTLEGAHINLSSLARLIKEQIVPLQLPVAMAAVREGQALIFGQLKVIQQGLILGQRLLLWSQIKSVRLEANQLAIYEIAQRKRWARLPMTRVPNMFLLFELADTLREASPEALPPTEPSPVEPESAGVPPLALENIAGQPIRRFHNRQKTHRLLLVAQALYLVAAGSLILFSSYHLPPPSRIAMPTPDIQATQTSMAQETSTVSAGNATAVALETVATGMSPQAYQAYTQGKPLFQDSLTDLKNTYFYDPDTMKPDLGCVFQKDGLHITSADVGYWIPCNNLAFPDLMNFSFQYTFSILKGDTAGLRFRALDTQCYYFDIDTSGNYKFVYYPDVMNGKTSQTIQAGTTKWMRPGYGTSNQLTVIAIGSLFYVYLNQQLIMKASDPTLSMGYISLLVDSETAPTEAAFSHAVAWNIAGMAP